MSVEDIVTRIPARGEEKDRGEEARCGTGREMGRMEENGKREWEAEERV